MRENNCITSPSSIFLALSKASWIGSYNKQLSSRWHIGLLLMPNLWVLVLWWHFSWYKRIYRQTHMHGFTAYIHNHDKHQFAVVSLLHYISILKGNRYMYWSYTRKKLCIKCNWLFKLTESGSILCFLKMTVTYGVLIDDHPPVFRKLLTLLIDWVVGW